MRPERGDVVGCYLGTEASCYGVIVALPTETYPRYRVRILTTDFGHYVELGVLEKDLTPESAEARAEGAREFARWVEEVIKKRKLT